MLEETVLYSDNWQNNTVSCTLRCFLLINLSAERWIISFHQKLLYSTNYPPLHTAKTQYRKFETIFPEKVLYGLGSDFHMHMYVSDLYISQPVWLFWAGIFKNVMRARHRVGIGLSYRPARAGIFKKSMGAKHRGGIGFSYRPAMLHRLAEFIPWNQCQGPINI
jgi:hypothetical protein